MVDNGNSDDSQSIPSTDTSVSVSRILKTVVPVVIALVAGAWVAQTYLPSAAQRELETSQLNRLLGRASSQPEHRIEFVDKDGDLLADAPADADCLTPEKLVFCYVASEDPGKEAAAWQPWLDALAEEAGLPTEYTHFTSVHDQLAALAGGELHVTAVNTGAVPLAVTAAGFIPTSTFGNEGEFGYTMNIIVATDSPVKELTDLRGKKVTFVRPNSNSGFKAALVHLMNEYDMLPERDYTFGFSMGHDTSVNEVIAGKTDAAPVASDLFDRMVAAGEVDESAVRVIYQSERFPPVAIGHSHQLHPELRESIAKLLTEFDWTGTPLAEAYGASGATGFVVVDYKDDWANIRRINDAIDEARTR